MELVILIRNILLNVEQIQFNKMVIVDQQPLIPPFINKHKLLSAVSTLNW
jgi:hypothetical protein